MQLYEFVQSERSFYESQTIPLVSGDEFSQYQLIRAINFTRRNKYMDDAATDDIIGDFPYDNISKYRIRLEARSTDFDIKHIEIEPVDSSQEARVSAMIASKALQKELRDMDFGRFLNVYADTRPEYGAFLCKYVDDKFHKVPFENVITDMTDILSSPIIEKHYYTPSQLKKQGWDNVDVAIETALQKKKDKDIKRGANDEAETVGRFIEVLEVTGEVSVAMLKEARDEDWEAEDEMEYVLARIIFAPLGKDEKGVDQGVVFFAEEISEDEYPYFLDVRHPLVGRAIGEGIPEELAEHQRWHNFYKTEEARAVAIGGKIVFYTDDGNVVDSIYAEGIEHGTILQVGEGNTFGQLNMMPNSVPMYQNIRSEWQDSADKNTSSFDAVIGEESKSGTPFRSQYLQNIAGTSQFEREREDMGFFIGDLITKRVLKRALEKAAKADKIDSIFNRQELDIINRTQLEKATLNDIVEKTLGGEAVNPEQVDLIRQSIKQRQGDFGTRRTITDIAEFIKKAGDKVIVHTTDEQRSKAVLFESLSNALMLFGENDPARMALRDRVLDHMGVSYEELAMYANQAVQAATPQQGVSNKPLQTEQLQAEESLAANIQQ